MPTTAPQTLSIKTPRELFDSRALLEELAPLFDGAIKKMREDEIPAKEMDMDTWYPLFEQQIKSSNILRKLQKIYSSNISLLQRLVDLSTSLSLDEAEESQPKIDLIKTKLNDNTATSASLITYQTVRALIAILSNEVFTHTAQEHTAIDGLLTLPHAISNNKNSRKNTVETALFEEMIKSAPPEITGIRFPKGSINPDNIVDTVKKATDAWNKHINTVDLKGISVSAAKKLVEAMENKKSPITTSKAIQETTLGKNGEETATIFARNVNIIIYKPEQTKLNDAPKPKIFSLFKNFFSSLFTQIKNYRLNKLQKRIDSVLQANSDKAEEEKKKLENAWLKQQKEKSTQEWTNLKKQINIQNEKLLKTLEQQKIKIETGHEEKQEEKKEQEIKPSDNKLASNTNMTKTLTQNSNALNDDKVKIEKPLNKNEETGKTKPEELRKISLMLMGTATNPLQENQKSTVDSSL